VAEKVHAYRGYDIVVREDAALAALRLAVRVTESSKWLGHYRRAGEGAFAWLSRFRRLQVREERQANTHLAVLQLGCTLICLGF
jgi:hypothetical protein